MFYEQPVSQYSYTIYKKFIKFFSKTIDILLDLWYNNNVERESGATDLTRARVTADRPNDKPIGKGFEPTDTSICGEEE